MILKEGELFVEHPNIMDFLVKVDCVIFHGIFANDFDTINTLALHTGICLPNPVAMLNCRLKLPCLARALQITKLGDMQRSFIQSGKVHMQNESVAKWGNWHCGENKEKFTGEREYPQATVIEPFIKGEAVRILIIGDKSWQIQLRGDDWLKSIQHSESYISFSIDEELLLDTRNLKEHFQLEWIAVDYIVSDAGKKYMLEVNHIPNMDRFPQIRKHYIHFISSWLENILTWCKIKRYDLCHLKVKKSKTFPIPNPIPFPKDSWSSFLWSKPTISILLKENYKVNFDKLYSK